MTGLLFGSFVVFQIFYPARGRKHLTSSGNSSGISFQIFYPARGRKLKQNMTDCILEVVSNFLPRKGTETIKQAKHLLLQTFQIFYPARGRKPLLLQNETTMNGFKFFTPQGDGNMTTSAKKFFS